MAGEVDSARVLYEELRGEGLLDTEYGIRYVWLLNEEASYREALAVLDELPEGPAVGRLRARTLAWLGAEAPPPQPFVALERAVVRLDPIATEPVPTPGPSVEAFPAPLPKRPSDTEVPSLEITVPAVRRVAAERRLVDGVDPADRGPGSGAVWLQAAASSERRGDLRRAFDLLERAEISDAPPASTEEVRSRLDRAVRPSISTEASASQDVVGLEVRSIFAEARLRPFHGLARVGAGGGRSTVGGLGTLRVINSGFVSVDSLFVGFVGPMRGSLALHAEQRGPTLLTGSIALGGESDVDGSSWGLGLSFQPAWAAGPIRDRISLGRVRDLTMLDPAMVVGDLRVRVSGAPLGERGQFEVEAGGSHYSGRSVRLFGSAAVRLPILRVGGLGVSVTPNVYGETFSEPVAGLWSPKSYKAVGLQLDGTVDLPRTRMEASGNTFLFQEGSASGVSFEASGLASVDLGPATLGVRAEYYFQNASFDVLRVSSRLDVPIGGW